MLTLTIKPREKGDRKIPIAAPWDALSFQKYQDIDRALNKHYQVTLLDPGTDTVRLLEFLVQDGHHKRFLVQNAEDLWQCSCADFIDNQADHCEHVGIVSTIKAHPLNFPNGYQMMLAIRDRLRKNLTKAVFKFSVFDGETNSIKSYIIGSKLRTKNLPIIESVSVPYGKAKILYEQERQTQSDSNSVFNSAGILQSGLSLYDYQETIFGNLLKAKRGICSMEMGSGKTLTSIACYGWIRAHVNPKAKALIICPKSLKRQWMNEMQRALGLPSVLIDNPASLTKLNNADVYIVTYQFFARHVEAFKSTRYDLVIMDEIQFIRNDESKIWKAAKQLDTQYFFGLSGTVIENKLEDLYAIMDVVAPGSLGPKWRFGAEFQEIASVTKKVLIFTGIKNIDRLHEKIKDRVFGYNKLVLPGITHTYKEVGMNPQQREMHDVYQALAQRLLAKSMTSGLSYSEKMVLQSYLLKSRQACNSVDLITKSVSPASPKMQKIIADIKTYVRKGQKIVLFSQWTEFLDSIARILRNEKVGFVYFTGRESEKQRVKSLEAFSKDPGISVFLASDAGGVGLDGLQFVSNVAMHTELPWNPARLDQRTGRVHRIGQTQPVEVIYYYATNSIEEKLLQVLQGKRDIRTLTLNMPTE